MKKMLVMGLCLVLAAPAAAILDWTYYRDRKPFISPIFYSGEVIIRNDAYGEGAFGARRSGGRTHRGIDLLAPVKSEVRAARGGRAAVRFQRGGMGKYVVIRHAKGYETLYGHLQEVMVKDNERVRQGSLIGLVGKTGNARHKKIEPHLHFEIRKNGDFLDPLPFLQ